MASKVIHAIYNDDDILMNAVKAVRKEHYHIEEVYTPSGTRFGQSHGIGRNAHRYYFVHVWDSWIDCSHRDDEFHHD